MQRALKVDKERGNCVFSAINGFSLCHIALVFPWIVSSDVNGSDCRQVRSRDDPLPRKIMNRASGAGYMKEVHRHVLEYFPSSMCLIG
jgi:hypothetical protein